MGEVKVDIGALTARAGLGTFSLDGTVPILWIMLDGDGLGGFN